MSYPADLEVHGRRVLVVGGHPAGLAPVSRLLAEGALVTVVAPEVATSLRDLAERGLITWLARDLVAHDLADPALADPALAEAALVVAATGADASDTAVRAAAATAGRLVVSARPVPVAPAAALPLLGEAEEAARTARAAPPAATGRVILVGGGPGDPGLITVAGLEAVRQADVLVCDRLAPLTVLSQARPGATVIDVAKIPRGHFTPQEEINQILVQHARAGRVVVRLKGGDNFVFGRGGEEWQACAAAGLAVEVIPGVSSALAAPSLVGIPLTHRQLTQGFTVVSGHLPPGDPDCTLDWAALARANTTLVILMGVATLPAITAELQARGLPGPTPAATVANAGLPGQRAVRGTLADIAEVTAAAGLAAPAVTVIGAVAGFDPHAG